jgi:hypothetical protein
LADSIFDAIFDAIEREKVDLGRGRPLASAQQVISPSSLCDRDPVDCCTVRIDVRRESLPLCGESLACRAEIARLIWPDL